MHVAWLELEAAVFLEIVRCAEHGNIVGSAPHLLGKHNKLTV